MIVETQTIPEPSSEFQPEDDRFRDARKRGTTGWILAHVLAGSNKAIVVAWSFFEVLGVFFSSYVMIVIGQAINAFAAGDLHGGIVLALLVLGLGVGAPIVAIGTNILRELLAQRMERDTRHEFFMNLLGKSQSFHDQQRVGDIMARTADDVRNMNFLISPALSIIIESSINIVIPAILILIYYPAQLVLEPIVFSVLYVLALRSYMKSLAPATQQERYEFGMMDAMLNESLSGIDVVKTLAREADEKKKYLAHADLYRQAMLKEGQLQARYIPVLVVAVVVTAGLAHAIFIGQSAGNVIGFVGLLTNLRYPTYVSIWAFATIRQAESSAERLLETMNTESKISENPAGISKVLDGAITFDHVTFTYPGSDKPVLKDITFSVEPGQTVAIVGTTGSGKTTLTKLLSRLYDVDSGQILVDGHPITEYSLQSLRSQIAFIEQDVFLFSTSIIDNITFGREGEIERCDAVIAARDAQADEFIKKLNNGYDTSIGEGGVQLSGGERQRIAIARAFLSNPRVLVLDDSTSAIDSATEEQIQRAMRRVMQGRTSFLITHRLSQIRWCDRIIVLKRGEIEAQGTHEELLQTNEEYRRIFVKRFDIPPALLLEGQGGAN
jgi:ATP-binding cassette subfamily B protein